MLTRSAFSSSKAAEGKREREKAPPRRRQSQEGSVEGKESSPLAWFPERVDGCTRREREEESGTHAGEAVERDGFVLALRGGTRCEKARADSSARCA